MATTLAFRFPLGRYHATPWDRSVNEGAVEWPPSPWRLLRALVATWYTRWPELPGPLLDDLLVALGDPPSYCTPRTWPAHTRHYLPDLGHQKGETGGTDLTLDPFLWLRRDDDLLVRWDADLNEEQRSTLAKLAELLPYLGRAESVCEARLLDEDIRSRTRLGGDRALRAIGEGGCLPRHVQSAGRCLSSRPLRSARDAGPCHQARYGSATVPFWRTRGGPSRATTKPR